MFIKVRLQIDLLSHFAPVELHSFGGLLPTTRYMPCSKYYTCVCILCNFLTKTFRQLASFLIKMFLFFRNIHYFHKLLNAKQVQQKTSAL